MNLVQINLVMNALVNKQKLKKLVINGMPSLNQIATLLNSKGFKRKDSETEVLYKK